MLKVNITKNKGELISSYVLKNGENEIAFELEHSESDIEFVVANNFTDMINFSSVKLRRLN